MIHTLKWYRCEKKASEEAISYLENNLPYTLPKLFLELMSVCDAGIPCNTDFEYFDDSYQCIIPQALGGYLGVENEEYNLLQTFKNPPEFFPKGLVAFAETGNGDFICFDYRQDKKSSDPAVVYWNHEADEGKDVSFVANTFEEFLSILKEPEFQ